jgi:hypothetical protein
LLGIGAVLIAVVLAVSPPARGPQFDQPEATSPRADYQVDDLLITVSLGPNQPGRSLLLVDVVSSRRPSPGPVTAVTADLGTGSETPLRRTAGAAQGSGRWQAAVDVDATGPIPLRIVVGRNQVGPAVLATTWVVPSGLSPRPVVVSNSRLAPWTNGGAVLVILGALGVWVALVGRRRRARIPVSTAARDERVPSGVR